MNRKPPFSDKVALELLSVGVNRPVVLSETESTNDVAKQMIKDGCADFTAVVAEKQTRGKGRNQKSFYSPVDTGAYVSVVMRADKERLPYLTVISALATARTVEEFSGSPAFIKWVNDIFVFDKKVAGILTETVADGQVVGIGTNLQDPDDGFPDDIKDIAGSLNLFTDKRAEYIGALTRNLIDEYRNFDKKSALSTYRSKSYLTGKDVLITDVFGKYKARVLDIDDEFGLVVMKDGAVETLRSGVVSISTIKEI